MHRWTSLACTLFMLVACLSGLPLIFRDEIVGWLDGTQAYTPVASGQRQAGLDDMARAATRLHPGYRLTEVFVGHREPKAIFQMSASSTALAAGQPAHRRLVFDLRTGDLLEESDAAQPHGGPAARLMVVMVRLHIDLYARLPGQLFMGFMALLLVAAVVSGVVLYGPFMQKLPFGTVRAHRSARIRWLDRHNLLGIVALAWTLMMGGTGALHELAVPLFRHWIDAEVRPAVAAWSGLPAPDPAMMAPVQGAYEAARDAAPDRVIEELVFPREAYGVPHHYLLWAKGDTALSEHLFDAVLVDARTGQASAVLRMPWYLRALQFSRPLHYGDYAGMPLKIIWGLLDLAAIVVLGSGLYLWVARRKQGRARLRTLVHAHAGSARR
ncbi:PepSY-associated TM helix domain-containing protein [Bordetella genomosp. 13]|uniref:PepSY-associated TM helix domain-containing protein n=1 Tax=Bordetella genomosp. 13 TaxID=463040 RepID=UPI0021B5892F|nr:PepSY-associated TM helix domain-containing protein [Bordetella genomosp. 13]